MIHLQLLIIKKKKKKQTNKQTREIIITGFNSIYVYIKYIIDTHKKHVYLIIIRRIDEHVVTFYY